MKRFILLSSGRAGSTSFIDTLAGYDDIAVPSKQIDCVDNEIFHPRFYKKYIPQYQTLSGIQVKDEKSFIEAFFKSNEASTFAGFKSMPNRHQCLNELASSGDVRMITISRDDVASTVASFIIAIDKNTWRREGGKQEHHFVFGGQYRERAFSHLAYILDSQKFFDALPNSIDIKFEDLCKTDFANDELNDFFQRPIQLENPRPPVSAEQYVYNWEEFVSFIKQKTAEIEAGSLVAK